MNAAQLKNIRDTRAIDQKLADYAAGKVDLRTHGGQTCVGAFYIAPEVRQHFEQRGFKTGVGAPGQIFIYF